MAYFNHAFRKVLLATNGISNLDGVQLGTPTAPGATTYNQLAPAELTFINPENFIVSDKPDGCCDIIVASGSIYPNDKIGKFHGGYQESNKTKTIKPQYVSKFWYVEANAPSQYVINVGYTPWNVANPPSSDKPGETAGTCCKEFLCGETYYLRLDVKGSPALRYLNHNGYLTLEGYTGCCPDSPDDPAIAPVPVDPRKVYFAWAKQILESPIINPFVYPIVTFYDGAAWIYYYPDSVDTSTLPAPGPGVSYANYSDWTEEAYTVDMCAGFTLTGAYEDTKFGNCTFQVSDFYELEPVRIYASEVDLTGAPCEFQTLCVGVECYGLQANGVGETVARDFILSESYRQNFFATDFRIREITQGDAIVGCNGFIDRNSLYDRIYLLHNVPRFYNPTGTFDNDQYLVEIIVPQGDINVGGGVFETINNWIKNCDKCSALPSVSGSNCEDPIVPFPFAPAPAQD